MEDMEMYKRAVPILLPIAQIGMTGKCCNIISNF